MTSAEFAYVCRLIRDRSAIVLEAGKEYLVESRLAPVARALQLESVGDLIAQLRAAPGNGLHTRVVEALVTSETSFFRDPQMFESLRASVLPDLIRRRASARELNVWSAACSTGQEAYSFALLLREHFPELARWRVSVLATDLSTEVLSRAREGKYTQAEINRGLPAALLVKHFDQTGTYWQLNQGVRRAVEFREMNLARSWPALPKMDVIFLRNVMIYFDVEMKKAILARAARVLRTDGYLILGGAETTHNLHSAFRRVESLRGGFYQFTA